MSKALADGEFPVYDELHSWWKRVRRVALILHTLLLFLNLLSLAGSFIFLKCYEVARLIYSRFEYGIYASFFIPPKARKARKKKEE